MLIGLDTGFLGSIFFKADAEIRLLGFSNRPGTDACVVAKIGNKIETADMNVIHTGKTLITAPKIQRLYSEIRLKA